MAVLRSADRPFLPRVSRLGTERHFSGERASAVTVEPITHKTVASPTSLFVGALEKKTKG